MKSAKKTGQRVIVGIAGGSGSGKTTFSRKVVEECRKIGISGRIFSLDHYYRPLEYMKLSERKDYNFDHPDDQTMRRNDPCLRNDRGAPRRSPAALRRYPTRL